MSVRQAIFDVAAGYAPFLAACYDGANSLFGSDTNPDPPPRLVECPWFYLQLLSDTSSFSGDPNYAESGFAWWGYDLAEVGYARIRKALGILGGAPGYREAACEGAAPYSDPDTGEAVFWQKAVGFGQETGDQNRGLLVLIYTWQTRKTFRVEWP